MAVFVSHSKHDVDLKKYFSQIFAHIGLKAKFMEWENLDTKYAGKEISDIIRGSIFGENMSAVIVLLGRNLQNPPSSYPTPTQYDYISRNFSRNDYSLSRNIQNVPSYQYTHNWVNFEVGVSAGVRKPVWVFEEFDQFIGFPIPYVTDYCQFILDSDEHIKIIGSLLQSRIRANNGFAPSVRFKCPHNNCNAEYNYWSTPKNGTMNCPVCRQSVHSSKT